jgi:hypothetical protein
MTRVPSFAVQPVLDHRRGTGSLPPRNAVIGLFDTLKRIQAVVRDLVNAGFARTDIATFGPDRPPRRRRPGGGNVLLSVQVESLAELVRARLILVRNGGRDVVAVE